MGMSIDEKNKFIEESKEHFKEWHDMNYIPKADYEARLKVDMVAMLSDIRDEIASNYLIDADTGKIISGRLHNFKAQKLLDSINNEIDKLEENINDTNTD